MQHNTVDNIQFVKASFRPRQLIGLINVLMSLIAVIFLWSFYHYYTEGDWKKERDYWRSLKASCLEDYLEYQSFSEEKIDKDPNLSDEEKTELIVPFYELPCRTTKKIQLQINSHNTLRSKKLIPMLKEDIAEINRLCTDYQKDLPNLVSICRKNKPNTFGYFSKAYLWEKKAIGEVDFSEYEQLFSESEKVFFENNRLLNKGYKKISELHNSIANKINIFLADDNNVLSETWIDHYHISFIFLFLLIIKMVLIPFIGFRRKSSVISEMTYQELLIESKDLYDKKKGIIQSVVTEILAMIFVGETLHAAYINYFTISFIAGTILMSSLISSLRDKY